MYTVPITLPYRISWTPGKSLRKSPIVWTEPHIKYNIIILYYKCYARMDSSKIITTTVTSLYIYTTDYSAAGALWKVRIYTCIGTTYIILLYIYY